jgi:hypothetical protein
MTNASLANELMGGMGAAVTPTAPTHSPSLAPSPASATDASAFVLFLFEKDSVGAARGQPYGAVVINPGDQSLGNIMMMSPMAAFAAVRLDQLDTVAFDMIDGAHMDTISADDLGMFLDARQINHHIAPVSGMTAIERLYPQQVALIH